jgi:hypothetical protein
LQCVLKWRWLFGFFVPRVGVSEKVRRVLNEKLCFDFAQMRETAVAFIGEEKEKRNKTRKKGN